MMRTVKAAVVLNFSARFPRDFDLLKIGCHLLTVICWISLLELGMGNPLVMHAFPAWFVGSCTGSGINIASCKRQIKKKTKTKHDLL